MGKLQDKYKSNVKKSKIYARISPFVYWGLLAISLICLFIALKNSLGNFAEMVDLLDKKTYTGEELQANYTYLIEKYGEWVIGNGANGFQITFINVKNVIFSGVMAINLAFSVVLFIFANLLGKWLLPLYAKKLREDSQDMVNIEILKDKE